MTRSFLLIASVTLLGCESASTTTSVESSVPEPALAVESPLPQPSNLLTLLSDSLATYFCYHLLMPPPFQC